MKFFLVFVNAFRESAYSRVERLIPDSLREQLYAEENQRLDRRKKSSDISTCGSTCHPVHLHLPSQMPIPITTSAAESTNPAPEQTDYLAPVTGEQ